MCGQQAATTGTMSVGGRAADLSKIKVPILPRGAEHDHIVPL